MSAKTKQYEVCCAGISYFEDQESTDASGAAILVNGNPMKVTVRRDAQLGQLVDLTESEAARLLALDAIQEPGSGLLPHERPPVATVFSVPANTSEEDLTIPPLTHGDPRDPHAAPTHTSSEQAPDQVGSLVESDEDDTDEEEFDLENASIAEIAKFIEEENPSIKDLVEAVGDDSALADRVIEAERSATGDNPRAGLLKKLEPVAESGEESDEDDSEDEDDE